MSSGGFSCRERSGTNLRLKGEQSLVIYLDNNATTRPDPRVLERVHAALDQHWQNPSSVHRAGQETRHAVELARRTIAGFVNVRPREIVFTGDGTESIELAIRGRALAARASGVERPVVITSKLEHSAVRDLVELMESRGEIEARWLSTDQSGRVDPDTLESLIDDRVCVISVQWANNETGVIQPIEQIANIAVEHKRSLHVDATQWVGKMPTDLDAMPGLGLVTFSPHKFHGPKGVGILVARRGVSLGVVKPGSQELGRRGGTENVPGILGAAAACEAAADFLDRPEARASLRLLRDRLEQQLLEACPNAVINGLRDEPDARLWNTSNIGFPRVEAEALLLSISERGVCASAGAACSSGSLDPSPVLLAMGIAPEIAHGSIRLSLSRQTTPEDVDSAVEIIASAANALSAGLPSAR